MQITHTIQQLFTQLRSVLEAIDDAQYNMPVEIMSDATIGAQTRHVIEFYTELQNGYRSGIVNYDERKRNQRIETDRLWAIEQIKTIAARLDVADKDLVLTTKVSTDVQGVFSVQTNYSRELLYNLEHTVHHMALIRVAINCITEVKLPASFGVAAATLQYREACAQ